MIYSRFGSRLTLIDKHQEGNGRLSVHATAQGAVEVREYSIGDFTADDGLPEINEAIAKLPWRVVEKKLQRGRPKH